MNLERISSTGTKITQSRLPGPLCSASVSPCLALSHLVSHIRQHSTDGHGIFRFVSPLPAEFSPRFLIGACSWLLNFALHVRLIPHMFQNFTDRYGFSRFFHPCAEEGIVTIAPITPRPIHHQPFSPFSCMRIRVNLAYSGLCMLKHACSGLIAPGLEKEDSPLGRRRGCLCSAIRFFS